MKYTRLVLSIITIVMAVLGLLKIISFKIALPIALLCIATINLLNGIQIYKAGNKQNCILPLASGVILIIAVIYTTVF